MILKLPENTKGRDFVVTDIHGCFDLLEHALTAVKFDPDHDRLIVVGDLVDRGPHSAQCLYYLAQPWFFSLRGNHEELFLQCVGESGVDVISIAANIKNGTAWIFEENSDTLQDIRRALEPLPLVIEIETACGTIGFVHADVPKGMDWETFKKNILDQDEWTIRNTLWGRKRQKYEDHSGVDGVHRVFFGHTPMEGGPKKFGNCFFIDTGAVFRHVNENNTQDLFLTIVDIHAHEDDILKPAETKHPLVRAAPRKPQGPAAAPKPPRPPEP